MKVDIRAGGARQVAILTDHVLAGVHRVTRALPYVLRHAPVDLRPHVYTFADTPFEVEGCTTIPARGLRIPFCPEMRMYAPRMGVLTRRLVDDRASALHLTSPGPSGLVARQIALRLGLPLIGSYHSELGEHTRRLGGSRQVGTLMQEYMRWLYGGCRMVLVPSEATFRHLVAHGWREDRLRVWKGGVDRRTFDAGRRSAAVRAAWQVSRSRPAILYAGRLSRDRGLALLGKLQRILNDHRMPHRFVIAGEGPMAPELQRMLPEGIFTGSVNDDDAMGEIMASADIFVFPSETDGTSHAVLDAQAAGLPVLVTDRGGARENMVDRETGYVCRAGSEGDFGWRLGELLADEPRRRRMGVAACRFADGRAWAPSLAPLFEAYRETLECDAIQSTSPDPIPLCAAAPARGPLAQESMSAIQSRALSLRPAQEAGVQLSSARTRLPVD